MKERGFRAGNVDATVSIERPKLGPFIEQMRGGLAAALEMSPSSVSVKAKTNEGLGAVGEMLAVRAEAVVLLEKQIVR
jgi:2-C-methyl-D-erythritol 2,4-cyclodiphosphate synthase